MIGEIVVAWSSIEVNAADRYFRRCNPQDTRLDQWKSIEWRNIINRNYLLVGF